LVGEREGGETNFRRRKKTSTKKRERNQSRTAAGLGEKKKKKKKKEKKPFVEERPIEVPPGTGTVKGGEP